MKIMSINAGSSSLKFSLFDINSEEVLISGLFERIGIEGGRYALKYKGDKIVVENELENHAVAVKLLLDKLIELQVISNYEEIEGVGHRVVHGKDKYVSSIMITDEVLADIISFNEFAPLHNPANVTCIEAFREVLPKTPMVAVFDTAFHQTMTRERYLYPVPHTWYEDYSVRKYGAHGTSHRFITLRMMEELGREDINIISCHLGNGSSITAVRDGKCIDTSMGFTPHAGVVMGTRSGDIDVSIIPYVMEKEGKSATEVMNDLNKKSGLLGVSRVSSDSRDIEEGIKRGDENCILAQEMFVNSIVKYIAQYYVQLGKVDAICFTAGIGERSPESRAEIIEKLNCLGIKIDNEANKARGTFAKISSEDSSVLVYTVPTDEELMIARDTVEIINK